MELLGGQRVEAALITLTRNRGMLPPEKRSEEAAARRAAAPAPLKVLDDAVAKTGWLVGALHHRRHQRRRHPLRRYTLKALKLDAFPNAVAWLERCLARPGAPRRKKPASCASRADPRAGQGGPW